ncbi:MAG TPA: DUF58 domain-containing protein [Anaerolineae bacterium]|nr:DUF58 domain-containing protein [Anaerolineae bacterium]HIQ05578.1 DUF58 domain-containing protein [Anaerolineae bacterium]
MSDSVSSSNSGKRRPISWSVVWRRRSQGAIDTEKDTQFSDAWLLLVFLLTLGGLAFRQTVLLLISATLLTIAAVAWVWNRLALWGLRYERTFSERRAFLGETVTLTLQVINRKPLPLSWLRISDVFPVELPLDRGRVVFSATNNLGTLTTFWAPRWYERVAREYHITCTQRGFFHFGPCDLETGDVFGLFSRKERDDHRDVLIVYPRVLPLAELGLPPKEPLGETVARRRIFEDPSRSVGVRDYQPEDEFRRVHWKATARRQALQSKVYEPATSFNLVVFLNVATLERHWQGVIPELLEHAISVAASIAAYGVEQRWPVGLIANGALPGSDQPLKVLPGRSPAQLTRILEVLAGVTPFATAPIEQLITAESPRLPWGSTLVLVTAVTGDAMMSSLAHLKEVGRQVVLISLAEELPALRVPGLPIYHLPYTGPVSFLEFKETAPLAALQV